MSELLTEIWDSMNLERKQITVDPLKEDQWEYMRHQDHVFNREVFNIAIADDKVTWQEQRTYWEPGESSQVESSLRETLTVLQAMGKLSCSLEEDPMAEEAFDNLVAFLTAKTELIDHEAKFEDCEFFYFEPLIGCGTKCKSLSFGGCQCHK